MYFGYGIKNSSLEQPYAQDDNLRSTSGLNPNDVNPDQQIELTIPKDRLKQSYKPENLSKSGNSGNNNNNRVKTKLNGGTEIPRSKWQTFD